MLSGNEPHSNCGCMGGSDIPCPHPQCSYCSLYKENEARKEKRKAQEITYLRRQMGLEQPAKKSVLPAIAPAPGGRAARPKDTTTITRAALEGLAEKAGLRMDWNDGNPTFTEETTDEEIARMKGIIDRMEAGILSKEAARSLAANAAASIDQLAGSVLKRAINETFQGDLVKNEDEAIKVLKDAGSTDADIDAAKKLLGWHPETSGAMKQAMDLMMPVEGSLLPEGSLYYDRRKDILGIVGSGPIFTGPIFNRSSERRP